MSIHVRSASSVAGSSVTSTPRAFASLPVTADSGSPLRSACVRTRCTPEVAVTELEPASPPRLRTDRSIGLPGLVRRRPPATLLVRRRRRARRGCCRGRARRGGPSTSTSSPTLPITVTRTDGSTTSTRPRRNRAPPTPPEKHRRPRTRIVPGTSRPRERPGVAPRGLPGPVASTPRGRTSATPAAPRRRRGACGPRSRRGARGRSRCRSPRAWPGRGSRARPPGSCASRDGVVLELEIGCDLHQRRASRGRCGSSRVCSTSGLGVRRPATVDPDEARLAVGRVDDEARRVVQPVVEPPARLVRQLAAAGGSGRRRAAGSRRRSGSAARRRRRATRCRRCACSPRPARDRPRRAAPRRASAPVRPLPRRRGHGA